ncbi:MAG: hypothetical protein CMK89_22310 [Pseudomonadales bacterium]|nr:hypothetical protein [Pseudomonadales bacterium]
MADQNSNTLTITTEPNEFYAPECFFGVIPDAPALQEGVLGIHLQRVECLILAAKDMFESNQKVTGYVLLETALNVLDQVNSLVIHDERVRKQTEGSMNDQHPTIEAEEGLTQ